MTRGQATPRQLCAFATRTLSNGSSLPRATNIRTHCQLTVAQQWRTSRLRDACWGMGGGGSADSFGSGFEIFVIFNQRLWCTTLCKTDQPTRHERGNVCYASAFVSVQLLNSVLLSFRHHFSTSKIKLKKKKRVGLTSKLQVTQSSVIIYWFILNLSYSLYIKIPERSVFCSPRVHLLYQKYTKNCSKNNLTTVFYLNVF